MSFRFLRLIFNVSFKLAFKNIFNKQDIVYRRLSLFYQVMGVKLQEMKDIKCMDVYVVGQTWFQVNFDYSYSHVGDKGNWYYPRLKQKLINPKPNLTCNIYVLWMSESIVIITSLNNNY